MKHRILMLVLGGALAWSMSGAAADRIAAAAPKAVALLPADLKWKPGPAALPKGAESVMLEGDMSRAQYFAVRLKLPAGYNIPAHRHPAFERVTVLEGTFMLGHGDKFDEAALRSYPPGSYISLPPKMTHFAYSKEGAVIQLASNGPWGITYVDPKDDPRKQATH